MKIPALVVLAVALAPVPSAGAETVVETIFADRLEPEGPFSPLPRWTVADRPTVALALSGGAAHGLAHIGVLERLEADGIEIDAIAGTSMGAVIGGFAAAGYRPGAIAEIVRKRDWNAILGGLDVPRRVLSRSEEIHRRAALVRLRVRRGDPVQVGALIESQLLERELYRYFLRAQLDSAGDFDRLRYRFRAVATDILTGERVAPASGSLVSMLRGSSAIPGAFRPVPWGEALLVDGGLVENVPVDTARTFGTDLVLAVDLTDDVREAGALKGALDSLDRSLAILIAAQAAATLARADVVIDPDVAAFPELGFGRNLDRLVEAGRTAYDAARDRIWAALESEAPTPRLAYEMVEVFGSDRVDPAVVAERLGPGGASRLRIASEVARILNDGPYRDGRAELVVGDDGRRVLRFRLEENPVLREIVRSGADVTGSGADRAAASLVGRRFSTRRALEAAWSSREVLLAEGRVFVAIDDVTWAPGTGTLSVRLSEAQLGAVRIDAIGEITLTRMSRFFEDLRGERLTFDRLADRLDEMIARGAIFDWTMLPEPSRDGVVDLRIELRGDDYFEAMGGLAYRDTLGWAGFARVAKANLTGRGDFVDLTLGASRERDYARLRYRTEYGVGFQNVGAELSAERFENAFPFVDDRQKLVDALAEEYRGERVAASLIRRLRWGSVGQGGITHERIRFEPSALAPKSRERRTTAFVRIDLNRRDRLLFPTRGGASTLSYEHSVGGDSLWRGELRADGAVSPGAGGRNTLAARVGIGLSDGTERRPHWFDPGGYRDVYGFIPYGAAAPQYVHAGLSWRRPILDSGALRVYVEAGTDAVRTAPTRDGLRTASWRVGYGGSVIAYSRYLGPIAVGAARNDEGADVFFLTVGYPFYRD